jgi:hypothetical protein
MDIKNLGGSLLSGSLINLAPHILKGALQEYFAKISYKEFVYFVTEKHMLWEQLTPEHKQLFVDYGSRIGPLDWLTSDWVIEAGRKSAPSIYSLLVSWPEGKIWLDEKIEDIKWHIINKEYSYERAVVPPAPIGGKREEPISEIIHEVPSVPERKKNRRKSNTGTKTEKKTT